MITKPEVEKILIAINNHLASKLERDGCEYPAFVKFITQISIFVYNKQNLRGSSAVSYDFPQICANFFKIMRNGAKERGHSTLLFENPEGISDPGKLKQLSDLNKKYASALAAKKKPPLPPGFTIDTCKVIGTVYKIPESSTLLTGEAYGIALELLDELLFQTVGVHFLID